MKTKDEIKKLFLMFQTSYLSKWTSNFTSNEMIEIAIEQWRKGLAGIPNQYIEQAMDYCRINLEWPPSIAEFLSHCEKALGLPDMEFVYHALIRRELNHPIVQAAYDAIGSWALKNDTEVALRAKVKTAYEKAMQDYRVKVNRGLLEDQSHG